MADGHLCNTCRDAFTGKAGNADNSKLPPEGSGFKNEVLKMHHQKYSSFVASKETGCFICNWLWAKHPHPPKASPDDPATHGFCIYAYVTGRQPLRRTAIVTLPGEFLFLVVCPWATNFVYEVQVYDDVHSPEWFSLEHNMGGQQPLSTVREWIRNCTENHSLCSQVHSSGFFPTRIIDVSSIEKGTAYLRNKDDVVANVKKRKGSFGATSTGSRPKASRPVSYHQPSGTPCSLSTASVIWIDSLCIFQDSSEDWAAEAHTMCDVYQWSRCNIMAMAASRHDTADNTSPGLFSDRALSQSRMHYPYLIELDIEFRQYGFANRRWIGRGKWIVLNDSIPHDDLVSCPLNTRGWVMQERFLSTKILYFGHNQIYWECLGGVECEADPGNRFSFLDSYLRREKQYMEAKQSLIKELHVSDEAKIGFSERRTKFDSSSWRVVVEKYSKLHLTKESDRLVAISGLAKLFQNILKDKYLAGLWQRELAGDLAWYPHNHRLMRRPDGDGINVISWSWASVCGGRVCYQDPYDEVAPPSIRLIDSRIVTQPSGGNVFGMLRSAELDISCKMVYHRRYRSYYMEFESTSRGFWDLYSEAAISSPTPISWRAQEKMITPDFYRLSLDTQDLVNKFEQNLDLVSPCILLGTTKHRYGHYQLSFLLLERVDMDANKYKRVAMLHNMHVWVHRGSTSIDIQYQMPK
ncbi:hypothetical protein B0T17DRAFT_636851 [Bombardia bombarda]|uniref:Heterokaryon incompatibility domain-containing protein n=1 Tax=Bombardia bombarda TaxID=252184 RepID=A0AA40CA06_9PEZI|nr:hypothetical protein B0T17DRAFT_636851 [Bombardia bombarda]